MSSAGAKAVFVTCLIINVVLWSQSRYGQSYQDRSLQSLWKRNLNGPTLTTTDESCSPLSYSDLSLQCAHVIESCPSPETFLSIPSLSYYFCAPPPFRPLIFAGLVLWLLFLFSTLGISASDFFTPNLATIATFLGLDENVAGVTFLAFGNASPDVFSTFSAMRADSGSLAIGELLGAASFIVSVVAGSMCIIKPFKVERTPFLRDVGFFTLSVIALLVILHDGRIRAGECASLVAMYACYAVIVVVGSWWERRRDRREKLEALIRAEYGEDETIVEQYQDVVAPPADTLAVPLSPPPRIRASSCPQPPRLALPTPSHTRTLSSSFHAQPPSRERTPSPLSSPHLSQMPSFSLVGALEFRQVVASLQAHAASSSLSIFDSPITPYAGGHYHRRGGSHASRTPLSEEEPWDATLGGLPLNERSPRLLVNDIISEGHESSQSSSAINVQARASTSISPIPSISHTPASPTDTASTTTTEVEPYVPPSKLERAWRVVKKTYYILFPALHHFREKNALGKIASLLAAPAVMALTLTLPVVVVPYDSNGSASEKMHKRHHNAGEDGRLMDFEEDGIERALIAEEVMQQDLHEIEFNKWLMAAQCVLGPLFCLGVLFRAYVFSLPASLLDFEYDADHFMFLALGTAVCGLAVAALMLVFADGRSHPTARMARCSMGFLVAIAWIMAIADEAVSVLQTFGFIFGLSDAIIGLTIFAVGNSLADLVANMSVAVFAPIMGFSACFGGPMVNILLGVGISGSYVISQAGGEPYMLHFSSTLLSSILGLLTLLIATLVIVPLNGYVLSRTWGFCLVGAYFVIMGMNIWVELRW
ncbi:Sodium/calcium exchanger protein-domain-containing protein [Suillus subaureus]|uniref:Sodium/calcium exchanger protein-domain-containing protein n=1 Tax=Suillus subaureus TaxID=48587 RepID=A0A9P7EH68_9AGAM|nr:Sodium/calcium exchanger protein-domain-containing protein [Suillus subaureus]KAG1821132.1 Sodium/calcium exchanger protein-domain-containing protein [Suillus subaureus]